MIGLSPEDFFTRFAHKNWGVTAFLGRRVIFRNRKILGRAFKKKFNPADIVQHCLRTPKMHPACLSDASEDENYLTKDAVG